MTSPVPRARIPRPAVRRLVVVAVILGAAGAAAGLWYLFLRPAPPIALVDYGMERPTSFIVLSISDTATIEFQLKFTRA